ncbi:MAG: glycoside hydrolase, partial [Acidobacteriota bacterium]
MTVRDTVVPSLAVAVDPPELWPPNHRMVEVVVAITASDECDPAPTFRLVSVTSSEPDDSPGPGDGETEEDVAGVELGSPDEAVGLRAERFGDGPGRTYELRYEAMDAAGNVTPA